MLIKVEQKHIDAGCRTDEEFCAVALAVAEAVGRVDSISVDGECIRAWYEDADCNFYEDRVATPDHVAGFIEMFDAGQPVEPFEFELPLSIAKGWKQC